MCISQIWTESLGALTRQKHAKIKIQESITLSSSESGALLLYHLLHYVGDVCPLHITGYGQTSP